MKHLFDLFSKKPTAPLSSDLSPKGWKTLAPERTGDTVRDYNDTWGHMRKNGLGYVGYNFKN